MKDNLEQLLSEKSFWYWTDLCLSDSAGLIKEIQAMVEERRKNPQDFKFVT